MAIKSFKEYLEESNEDYSHRQIHKEYSNLKSKPTAEVLKIHKGQSRVDSHYSAAEVGGKQGLIASILHHRHGEKRVSAYFAKSAKERKAMDESLDEADKPKASEFAPGTKVKSFDFPGTRTDCYMTGTVTHSDDNYHYIDVDSHIDKGVDGYSFAKKIKASKFPHPHTGEHGVVAESLDEDNAKFKVTDVTPKGYVPDDEAEESTESKRLKLVISRARNGQRAGAALGEAAFYPANMDSLTPEQRKLAHTLAMKKRSDAIKKLADMRSMSPEELHASMNKKSTNESDAHDRVKAVLDKAATKNTEPTNDAAYAKHIERMKARNAEHIKANPTSIFAKKED